MDNQAVYPFFVFYLKTFLNYLKKNYPLANGVEKIIEKFDQIDLKKIIKRYIQIMSPYEQKLKNSDATMFVEPIFVFPGVDITELWNMPNTTEENKEHIWLCLTILFSMARIVENKESEDDKKAVEKVLGSKKQDDKLSVDSLMESHKNVTGQSLDKKETEFDIKNIMSIPGLSGCFDLNGLSEKLATVPEEEIKNATDKMKSLLSAGGNDKVADMMGTAINDLFSEFKKNSSKDGATNFLDVIKTLSDKMKTHMETNNIQEGDITNFANSALDKFGFDKNLISQFTNGGGANIMQMLPQLQAQLTSSPLINELMESYDKPSKPKKKKGKKKPKKDPQ